MARLNSSTPFAEGRTRRLLRQVWCRWTSFHLLRCGSPWPRLYAVIGSTALHLHQAITRNTTPTTDLAMRAAAVVTAHTALRDAFLLLGVGREPIAGRTWTRIAAHHRGRTRAELLTMAALAYYCAEDTVRAGLALGHAAVATEDDDSALPRLAEIIYTALDAGMPPSRIRSVIPDRNAAPIPGTTL